jgi:hypothetical protein
MTIDRDDLDAAAASALNRAVSAGQLKGLVPGSPDLTGAGPGRRAGPVIRHDRTS